MTLASDAARTPEPECPEAAGPPGTDVTVSEAEAAAGASEAGASEAGASEIGAAGAVVAPRPASPATQAAWARDAAIVASILRLVAERGPSRSICPSEAAREVAQAEGRADWHLLMGNVRRIAGLLQAEGRVEILRKGRPAAADVRGVIRLRQPDAGVSPAASSSPDPVAAPEDGGMADDGAGGSA